MYKDSNEHIVEEIVRQIGHLPESESALMITNMALI
jgi:hypothetical protein